MTEYPPDAAVPLPDDITQTTPAQFADWYAAEATYRTGVGAYHLIHGGDPCAAAEAFSASSSAYAVSALARALVEHAPDAVAGAVSDINAVSTAGDVSDRAGEWLHEIGVDGLALHEAGHEDTAKARARDVESDTAPTTPTLCAAQCPHGHDHTCARSPKHFGPHRDMKQKGEEGCAWTEHDQAFRALDAVDERIIHRVARLETDLARRVADLEQQHADLARLVHGHGEDIGQAQAAIRGLGSRFTAEEDG